MNDAPNPAARIRLHESWKQRLLPELLSPQMQALREFLRGEMAAGKEIYPPPKLIFNALDHTPFERVKVVILGQDPYHGPNQAHGLCFSVQPGIAPPPSLLNIFKELQDDIGIPVPSHGNLNHWAEQGVFLLNASLTVRAGEPMSHAKIGWAPFTDAVIKTISDKKEHVVFLLWGKFAQEKSVLINQARHLILRAAHPSPLSAYAGFLGCKHFSKTNEYLVKHGIDPVDWSLP